MRYRWLAWSLSGLLLLGCSAGSQPEANRGPVKEGPDRSSSFRLPEGHPPIDASAGGDESPLDDSGGEVRLAALTLTAPEGWGRKPPQSSFIEAEFALPKAEGDEADGRLTVSIAGGSIEANIDRWKSQFTDLKDTQQETFDANGIEITLVDLAGKFTDQRGPFAPAVTRPDYRMIAAIIPVDEQLHFVKATGPQKTIAAHADEIKEFARSAKRNP